MTLKKRSLSMPLNPQRELSTSNCRNATLPPRLVAVSRVSIAPIRYAVQLQHLLQVRRSTFMLCPTERAEIECTVYFHRPTLASLQSLFMRCTASRRKPGSRTECPQLRNTDEQMHARLRVTLRRSAPNRPPSASFPVHVVARASDRFRGTAIRHGDYT